MIAVEHACLKLSAEIGLRSVMSQILNTDRERCLLLKRFDVTENNHRRHIITANALLKNKHTLEDPVNSRYQDIAGIIQKHSSCPDIDLQQLFAQMLLNKAINNVDDHLRNFSFSCDKDGWRLTPVYDVVPDLSVGKYPQIGCELSCTLPRMEEASNYAKSFFLTRPAAIKIVKSVQEVVNQWDAVFSDAGVSFADINKFKSIFIPPSFGKQVGEPLSGELRDDMSRFKPGPDSFVAAAQEESQGVEEKVKGTVGCKGSKLR